MPFWCKLIVHLFSQKRIDVPVIERKKMNLCVSMYHKMSNITYLIISELLNSCVHKIKKEQNKNIYDFRLSQLCSKLVPIYIPFSSYELRHCKRSLRNMANNPGSSVRQLRNIYLKLDTHSVVKYPYKTNAVWSNKSAK